MQNPYKIPLISTSSWDNGSLEDLVVSFTMLEESANQIFQRINHQMDKTMSHISSVQERIQNATVAVKQLEKKDVLTVFYSSSLFPATATSNDHLESLELETMTEDNIRDIVKRESSMVPDALRSHLQGDCDEASNVCAIQSLYATSAPASLRKNDSNDSFGDMCTLYSARNTVERISNRLIANEPLYDASHFAFHVSEEPKEHKRSSIGISDSEDEDEEESRHIRVSLMLDDVSAQSSLHMSLLHKSPMRQTSKPEAAPSSEAIPPAVSPAKPSIAKPSGPPPPPTSTVPSSIPSSIPPSTPARTSLLAEIRMSGGRVRVNEAGSAPEIKQFQPAAAAQKPVESKAEPSRSKPMTPHPNAQLLAEIRASGGRVKKPTPQATDAGKETERKEVGKEPMQQASVANPMENRGKPSMLQSNSRLPMSLLDEIRSVNRKEILTKVERSTDNKDDSSANKNSPGPDEELQPVEQQVDMLQRRKLLFIDSSSSESSDWDMSD